MLSSMHTELKIPVPWGHIAAKEWGDPTSDWKLLGVHGWQDNANTFDGLAPLLPESVHFVAIDFPGHGLSSHIPAGMHYHFSDWVTHLHRIVTHLQWKSFNLLAHSMGAAVAVLFAGTFPDSVKKLIMLDQWRPIITTMEKTPERLMQASQELVSLETTASPRSTEHNYEDALQRYIKASSYSVNENSAKILLERGTVQTSNGKVIFRRDHRLKVMTPLSFTADHVIAFANRTTADILLVNATETPWKHLLKEAEKEVFDIYKKNCRKFHVVEIKGSHHFHLNMPQTAAPLICAFLKDSPLPIVGDIILSNL